MRHSLSAFVVLGVLALALGACGGESSTSQDDALVVDDTASTSQAVSSPDPSGSSGGASGGASTSGDDADDPKSDCNDHDHGGHRHHRHHMFKVLDKIDGTEDHQITIASLPTTLPARLIARLHEMDANGDGIVTKDEAKAWHKDHKGERGGRKDH